MVFFIPSNSNDVHGFISRMVIQINGEYVK